jgi:hypothetical protein
VVGTRISIKRVTVHRSRLYMRIRALLVLYRRSKSSLVLADAGGQRAADAYAFRTHVVGLGPGEARTRHDEASRRGGRARTRRDSIPNAMYRVWWVGEKDSNEDVEVDYERGQMRNALDERDDGEQAGKRKGKPLGARRAGAWLDAANAPKASRVARLLTL